jgi:hypothetical protein
LSAQPTGILGTRLKPSRQRALGLGFGSFALAGVLYYQLETDKYSATKKMVQGK